MARLSIIVTSYNIEDYLEECLRSIVDQTLRDLEIIVVDDGSSDGTPAIIERFAAEDDRIVPVLLEDNTMGGVATAANTGLDRATAPWVGFADGDDVYDVAMFERLLTAAERWDADLAMCQYQLLDDQDGSLTFPADQHRWGNLMRPSYDLDLSSRTEFLRFIAVPWRKLYRRSMLEEHALRFPVGDYFYEDNPFHWFTLLTADRLAVVPEVLCWHRVSRAGQTMSTIDARLFKIFQHHDTILTWLEDTGLADDYAPTLLGWAMSQMDWIARRTPLELREELFGVLRGVYLHHSPEVVEQALVEGDKGKTTRRLSEAVLADNLPLFNRLLDHTPGDANPLVSAAWHLRNTGVSGTARVTARWMGNQLRRTARRVAREKSRLGGDRGSSDARAVTNEDLLFALVVLEQRLDHVEQHLADLDGASGDR